MTIDGLRPSTRKGGFAQRASKAADAQADGASARTSRYGGFDRGGPVAQTPDSLSVEPRPSGAQLPDGSQRTYRRVRMLAALVAVSVAVSFAAIVYGLWARAASASAVEEATAGAAPVLVAATDIHAGDVLTSESFVEKDIPAAYRASEAIGLAQMGQEGFEGRCALVDMAAGTQVLPSFVAGSADGGRLSARLHAGMEAVTVGVDAETGLAGRIGVHDTVRVVSAEGSSSGASVLSTLCAQARVLAVGEGAVASGDGSYASVTVEVKPEEADAIRAAQYAGRVSLVMVSSEDALLGGDDRG